MKYEFSFSSAILPKASLSRVPVCCISGISGQDGSYLAEFLLSKGYEVHGIVRRSATSNTKNIDHILDKITLHYGDLGDSSFIDSLIYELQPNEFYNLAAQSDVAIGFELPVYTSDIAALGPLRILEAIRKYSHYTKFYQASTSETMGNAPPPQDENTVRHPDNPYGCFPTGTRIVKKSAIRGFNSIPIENLKVGDMVLSFNETTHAKEEDRILNIMSRDTNKLYEICFSNDNKLSCTEEHPFYVLNKGWIKAKDLHINDEVLQYKYIGLNFRLGRFHKKGKKLSQERANKLRSFGKSLKNKTYDEIYGIEKANLIKDKISKSQLGKKRSYKYKLSEETKAKMKGRKPWNIGLTKEIDNRLGHRTDYSINKSSEFRENISNSVKKLWKNPEYIKKQLNARSNCPNKHEKVIIEILEDLCPNEFGYNGGFELGVMLGRKIPDFVNINGKKKLIEYFGTYWHSKEYKMKDVELQEHYRKLGWESLIIWEDELKDIGCLKQKIKTFIYNPNVEIVSIVDIKIKSTSCKVYNIETEKNHNYFAYGILVHNCAKLFAEEMVRLYRKSYGLFACSGILWNHESILKNSPLLLKRKTGLVDVLPIEELFKSEHHKYEGIKQEYVGEEVWNGENWTKIVQGTCYQDKKKPLKLIQTREACYEATLDHVSFTEDNQEKATKDWKVGDRVFKEAYPESSNKLAQDLNLCKFLGYVVGDGHISEDGNIRLTGTNKEELVDVANLILSNYGWTYRINTYGPGGFENCTKEVWNLDINNDSCFGKWLRKNIYTQYSREKKVPMFILNGNIDSKKAFFDGYYMADGRKAGDENYHYKGFTTNSAVLCLGLLYLFKSFSSQEAKVKCEYRDSRRYYYVQFRNDKIVAKGQHLIRTLNEVINVLDTTSTDGWFFDIQTESQTFATGPNLFKVHNSPRRGDNFVTQKVVKGLINCKLGKQEKLYMGNIDSKRDWGYAGDYVEAMWLMLQQNEPDDYAIGTGEAHTVRNLLEVVGKYVKIEWQKYVEIDSDLYRPTETNYLLANAKKAEERMGWKPKIKFEELVKLMIDAELKRQGVEL